MDSTLTWSAQFTVVGGPGRKTLGGDKIILPQSALEGLLAAAPVVKVDNGGGNASRHFDPFNPYSFAAEAQAREALAERQQQLPHPLTFRLVNPRNGHAVYAGIREFSAEENEVHLSPFLQDALGVKAAGGGEGEEDTVTVHAKQVPKGTYVRLRPLEAGYDAKDWKALLERYLRGNFTTLTVNQVLDVPGGGKDEHFRFLVDKFEPAASEGICVVDTDLEVDIEPLSEEQARETLNRRLEKAKRAPAPAPGTAEGSSAGGVLELEQEVHGRVVPGEYVDYQLVDWAKFADAGVDVEVSTIDMDGNGDSNLSVSVDIFVSPISARQQARPRADQHVLGDMSSRPTKRIKLRHEAVNADPSLWSAADTLAISIHAWPAEPESDGATTPPRPPVAYKLAVYRPGQAEQREETAAVEASSDEAICKNCRQAIPNRTLPLHEAFCYRNNVSCPKCHNVFLKTSAAWKTHWHCEQCNDANKEADYGSGRASQHKHNAVFHPPRPLTCPGCGTFTAADLATLAQHRTSSSGRGGGSCPAKEIICQFCHLLVPQRGPDDEHSLTDAEVLLSGLTPHELGDGARTTECHVCGRFVRLRDMKTHVGLHDRDRLARPRPRVCANPMCARTISSTSTSTSTSSAADAGVEQRLGLCRECLAPLYGTTHDPEGKALRRRIERRLLQQLMAGCGKAWCRNAAWCRTAAGGGGGGGGGAGDQPALTAREALPRVKPILDELKAGTARPGLLHLCVDESTQTRRALADAMAAASAGREQDAYEVEWCVKALEESKNDVDKAHDWLRAHAPRINEVL